MSTDAHLDGHGIVRVDLGGARVHALKLQVVRGGAEISKIAIQYSDGSHGLIQVNRTLDRRDSRTLRFDIGHDGRRGIEAIVVYGSGHVAFHVLATRVAAA